MASSKTSKAKKRSFSGFKYGEAFKQLGIEHLHLWELSITPIPPSSFLQQHFERLKHFDLQSSEESKKLIIDAILLEAILSFPRLKVWKGANLESDELQGAADYLISEDKAYLDIPFVCIVEAKRDDFYQCLVEMQACQWKNRQEAKDIDILGIVTNGEGWKYYKLNKQNMVYETPLYAISNIAIVLGGLHHIFQECETNLDL
jgi:hypothetical protein